VIHKSSLWVVCSQPFFALVSKSFCKCKFNGCVILPILVLKLDLVSVNRAEILLRLLISRCAETLVVLNFEGFNVLVARPLLILRYREESRNIISALAHLDDRSDELL